MPTAKENAEEIDKLRAQLQAQSDEIASLRAALGDHDARIETMEVAKPPELRRLTLDAVSAAIDADPYARFEVLKDWAHGFHELRGGSVIRADHFPHLTAYVRSGLMLGVPTDQAEVIARMKREAEAKAEAALAETKLAEAAAARAQATAAEARAHAAAVGGDTPTTTTPPGEGIVEDSPDLDF